MKSKSYVITMPGVWRPLVRLAGPVVVEQLLTLMVGLVDTWLTGNFVPGEAPMAAVGLMAYLLWLIPSLFASIAIGATALVARFVGAGDVDDARRTTNQAFLCGALLATVITVAFWFGADWLVAALGLVGEAQMLAIRYLRWIVPIIPAVMIIQVGMACLRGAGDTFSGFVAMACVNVVNALVSAALVTGFGPFPHLGWEGMAIGTAMGHALGAMIILFLLLSGRFGLKLNFAESRPNWDLIRRLFRVGAPGGLDVLSVLTCHLCFVRMVNGLGTLASSAHMLAVRIEAIAYLPGTAFQVSAGTMAGQYLGAEDHDRAIRGVRAACWAGLAMMGVAGLLFYFGGPWLTAFFTGDAGSATALTAVPVLRVAAFAMPGMALTMVLSGALRGAGDTRWPLVITLIGFLCVRIPGAWWAMSAERSVFGLAIPSGLMGAWVFTVVDLCVRATLAMWRFRHGGWRKSRV